MRRQGGGFGILMLLVVVAIIAYMAMRNARTVAPTAMEIERHNQARREVATDGAAPDTAPAAPNGDAWNPTPPARPSLQTVDQKTSEHSATVQDALSQSH
jgi:hypothetical protein